MLKPGDLILMRDRRNVAYDGYTILGVDLAADIVRIQWVSTTEGGTLPLELAYEPASCDLLVTTDLEKLVWLTFLS